MPELRRRPVPREWRELNHDLDLRSKRRYAGRDGSRLGNRAGGICSCGARFGLSADRHNMDAEDVREAWKDHVEEAYYAPDAERLASFSDDDIALIHKLAEIVAPLGEGS